MLNDPFPPSGKAARCRRPGNQRTSRQIPTGGLSSRSEGSAPFAGSCRPRASSTTPASARAARHSRV